MKKKLLYFITYILVLVSCSTNDMHEVDSVGILEINPISIDTNVEVSPLSRAVDARLQVDIYSESTIVKTLQAGDVALNYQIELPVGDNYRLVAHTPNMNEAGNNEAGEPLYSVSHNFVIDNGIITRVEQLTAKQVNVGINIVFNDELFNTAFQSVECIISSSSGRSVTVDATQSQEKIYFNVQDDTVISYQIKSVNIDGETFETEVKSLTLDSEIKDYTITVTI